MTHLGLNTGFRVEELDTRKHKLSRAGLEFDIESENCPFIFKSPRFCDYAEEVISRNDIIIEHVIVPMRDLNAAAESRRHVVRTGVSELSFFNQLKHLVRPRIFRGGLWHTSKPKDQEDVLSIQIYKLILALSNTSIPITFMRYPRIVKDRMYLYEKLKPAIGNMDYDLFCEAFDKSARPALVHSFNENDS